MESLSTFSVEDDAPWRTQISHILCLTCMEFLTNLRFWDIMRDFNDISHYEMHIRVLTKREWKYMALCPPIFEEWINHIKDRTLHAICGGGIRKTKKWIQPFIHFYSKPQCFSSHSPCYRVIHQAVHLYNWKKSMKKTPSCNFKRR